MKKRTWRIVLLGTALAVGSFTGFTQAADDTPKPAQPAPPTDGNRPPRRTPADMIKNYRDQFEGLNLSEDQMKKIDGFVETAEAEIKKGGDFTDREARTAGFAAMGKLNEDVQSVLNDTQKAQLSKKQQAARIDRFKAPYINPELKLSDDQRKKIDAIIDDMQKNLPTITFTPGAPPDREAFQKMFQVYKDTNDKLKAVLTPEQQKLIPEQRFGRPRPAPPANN